MEPSTKTNLTEKKWQTPKIEELDVFLSTQGGKKIAAKEGA